MHARAIGHFQIEAEAASGAAGTVYQALDRTSGVRVAVKVLHGVAVADAARFAREAKLLSRIRHPGVVRYVDHGTTDEGDAYLVMEWLEGEDLRRRLTREGLSIDQSVVLGRRVAEALSAVHAMGIVHRDVKPANIFLPGGVVGEAKIVDFGLVRNAEASAEVTRTGMVVGTPSYMAPEQARGQKEIDARADLFSLGCVLYKCLTGRAPFEGSSLMAVLTKVLLEEAAPPRALRSEIPAALDHVVTRLLAKDPDDRPPNAAAVAAALAAIAPLGSHDESAAPSPVSSVISGLTAGEQRISSVLLIGTDRRETLPGEDTLPSGNEADEPVDAANAGGTPAPPGAVVHEHGGQLDSLLDGTRIVTFSASVKMGNPVGVPQTPPGLATDHAARAARCALSLRAVLPGAPMAIATGRSEVGHSMHAGDAIERAAVLVSAQGEEASWIALDDTTAALLGPRFELTGSSGSLRLVGATAAPSAPTLLGKATPMVGREWELGSIRDMFTACVEEREPRTMLVTGAAGMGKSRLGHEAASMLRDLFPEVLVWWGRADPLRSGSALALLGQLVRDAGTAGADLLDDIAGLSFPARQDARIVSERIRAAWEALVDGATRTAPLFVVLEDAQWADAATLRFVGGALDALRHRPWMVLVLARPEVHEVFPRLWDAHAPQEIRLGPLSRKAGERLVRLVLDDAGAETVERLVQQADGNAFYLEELIRAVAETVAVNDGGPSTRRGDEESRPSTRPAPPARRGALPETVLAMVEARLSGLDAGTRRILRAASIFGEVFWPGGVTALLGGSAPPDGWVDALIDRELVTPRATSRFAGERELGFRHALLCDGAYATLTEGDRVLGHALAGDWLERHGETDAMVLAHHFEAARDEARAGRFYLTAAAQALRAADIDAAVERGERALAQASTEAARVDALSILCEAHAFRDDWAPVTAYADEAARLSPPGTEAWIRAMSWKQSAALVLGKVDELLPTIMALVSVEGAPGTGPVLVPALAVTAFVLAVGAQTAMAAGIVARMEVVAAREGPQDPIMGAAIDLGNVWASAWGPGDAWAALGHARAAMAGAETAHDARLVHLARTFLAMSLWQLGLLAEADAALPPEAAASPDLSGAVAALYRAMILVDRGLLPEARAIAARRIELARTDPANTAMRTAEGRWLLGEAAAREGDLETAERDLEASLPGLVPSVVAWHVAAARLASVRLARGRVHEALALARDVHTALIASGGHGLRGTLVRKVYAEALHGAGDHAAARTVIRDAWDHLRARAGRIADPEIRRRFLADVPENAGVAALARDWLG